MGLLSRFLGIPEAGQRHQSELSIGDPRLLEYLSAGWIQAGTGLPSITEADALSIPAYARGEALIAGTIAGLPLKAYEGERDGIRREVSGTLLDRPQGPMRITKHDWVERIVAFLVRYREAYLRIVPNDAGAIAGLEVVHPGAVMNVEAAGWGKEYTLKIGGTNKVLTDDDMVQILHASYSGYLRGTEIWQQHRATFQIAKASLSATGRVFTGATIAGLVTPEAPNEYDSEDIPPEEMQKILAELNSRISGTANAGQIAAINRRLKLTPWSMTNEQAQFAEVSERVNEAFATLLGIPPVLLSDIEKQTSWGTGVAEQSTNLSKYTLRPYTDKIEAALTDVLPEGVFAEFDYKGLLQGSPQDEINLLIAEVGGPILDRNEARAVLNLPPSTEPAPTEAPIGQ